MNSYQTTTSQKNLVLYFQVHQPRRLRTLRFFDIGGNRGYFDDDLNRQIIQRIAANCYLPANALLQRLIRKYPSIKVAFSISGVTIDQLEEFAPEVLDSFRALADTERVEFLAETYYHSLACLIPGNEFELQVTKHQQKIERHFGVAPTFFRNTELILSDDVGERISQLGFKGVFADGIERMLGRRSAHQVYRHPQNENLSILLRDYRLSDEISFRFSDNQSPLTAGQYINWLHAIPSGEQAINIAMDYETFGEHQKREKGIFDFLEKLLATLARDKSLRFLTPSEAAVLKQWRNLQTSDHFYYMSTKKGDDGGVHSYFSPYPSPYEAFINFMNVLTDFGLRVKISKSAAAVGRKNRSADVPEEAVITA